MSGERDREKIKDNKKTETNKQKTRRERKLAAVDKCC